MNDVNNSVEECLRLAPAPNPSRSQACLVSAPRDERLANPFQKERTPSCRARLMLVEGGQGASAFVSYNKNYESMPYIMYDEKREKYRGDIH